MSVTIKNVAKFGKMYVYCRKVSKILNFGHHMCFSSSKCTKTCFLPELHISIIFIGPQCIKDWWPKIQLACFIQYYTCNLIIAEGKLCIEISRSIACLNLFCITVKPQKTTTALASSPCIYYCYFFSQIYVKFTPCVQSHHLYDLLG